MNHNKSVSYKNRWFLSEILTPNTKLSCSVMNLYIQEDVAYNESNIQRNKFLI